MDIFLTHVALVDSVDVVYKYTCIELKADRATEKDLKQVLRYEDWLARRLAAGDKEMVQSILVARRFSDDVRDYVRARQRIEEKTVRLITYRVTEDKQGIELQEETILP
jgi:RecB family endonuclease NucS